MLKSKRGIAKTQLTPDIQKVIYIQHKNTTHTRHTKSYISYNTIRISENNIHIFI